MAQVFISFIHEEAPFATGVQNFIQLALGEDVRPFLSSDTSAVYAGARWMDRIVEELKNAKVVLLMLSPESVKRPWVNFEAGAAWIREVAVIPVCYNGLAKDTLPKPYSNLQGVDLSDEFDQYYLVKSVAHYLGLAEPKLFPDEIFFSPSKEEESFMRPYRELNALLTLLATPRKPK